MPEFIVNVTLHEKGNTDQKFTSRRLVTYGTIIDAWRPLAEVLQKMPSAPTPPRPDSKG